MQTLPAISVVVPHLNQQAMLERCLASLGAQNYPRSQFEVIVVDNGSEELPEAIVSGMPGARLAVERQAGPGPARNRGVSLAKGEVLAFIDADCVAAPGWLSAISERFASAGPQVILGGDVRVGRANPPHYTALEAYENIYAYRQKTYIQTKGFSGTGNLAVRRHDFDVIGPFAGIDQAEDRAWGRQARLHGFVFEYLPGMIVYHPARTSLSELFAKWDRHVVHDYTDWRSGGRGYGTWLLRAAAIAASIPAELVRILASRRIDGLRSRVLAFWVLLRVRLYRAVRMIRTPLAMKERQSWPSWNRPTQSL